MTMIDTHCHIDLFDNPNQLINECEKLGIITIGITNLPSHFEQGYKHTKGLKKVRLALGLHPLLAENHNIELPKFFKMLKYTSYIGEVGLDFSREGYSTKDNQIASFKKILGAIQNENKLLSIHSRRAEKEVLNFLKEYKIRNAIFHWYSGALGVIDEVVKNGYFFSVNTAMIKSESGKKIISRIPKEKILTESDGPFIEENGNPVKPYQLGIVYEYLGKTWGVSKDEAIKVVRRNFSSILISLKN